MMRPTCPRSTTVVSLWLVSPLAPRNYEPYLELMKHTAKFAAIFSLMYHTCNEIGHSMRTQETRRYLHHNSPQWLSSLLCFALYGWQLYKELKFLSLQIMTLTCLLLVTLLANEGQVLLICANPLCLQITWGSGPADLVEPCRTTVVDKGPLFPLFLKMVMGFWTCHPKTRHPAILNVFSWRNLRNGRYRRTFSPPPAAD